MNFETYIARRYFRSGRTFTSASTLISLLGVALGVAATCVVMTGNNGFEREIRTRLLGTTSHITVFPIRGGLIEDYRELVDTLESIDHVVAASPFIYYKAAIQSASQGDGIIVRGIKPAQESRTASIGEDIIAGDFSFDPIIEDSDTVPGILLGKGLANRLAAYVGEPVVLYSISGEDLSRRSRPRVAKFYVSGIFESGMYEFDAQLAYISLPSAQDLFKTGDAVTAVHLKLTDIFLAEQLAPKIDSALGFRYDVVPWNILHKNLFGWIQLEKLFLFLGFSLIVIVAAFSIISTLVMTTMEKRPEIGILKTLGTTPRAVSKIFIYKGLAIGVLGTLLGWSVALVLAWVQNRFHLISLPPDIYFISYLPFELNLWDFVAAGAITLIVCFLASLYPAREAARVSVIDVLRE